MMERSSGILLHFTSLPSEFGIGDSGPEAYRFVDFLNRTGQSLWQVLPFNPVDSFQGFSPYSSSSAFAMSPLCISPRELVRDGLLAERALRGKPDFPLDEVAYSRVEEYKQTLFDSAFETFEATGLHREEYEKFCSENAFWLDDYALFVCLKQHYNGTSWNLWPASLRDRDTRALRKARAEHERNIHKEKFLQYICGLQWGRLHAYASRKNIRIVGDIPIYVTYDSADVWSNPSLFKLDAQRNLLAVAGVPPDYFSKTGQLWGNPVYDWETISKQGFSWWLKRLARNQALADCIRIDHFRGLVAYWEVPSGERTAIGGSWIKAPADAFLAKIRKELPSLEVIAEDLGVITDDVRRVMKEYAIPGMKVLLFAFGEEDPMHIYLPHTYEKNCVVYTGTHDNNTARGWFEGEITDKMRRRVFAYLGKEVSSSEINWELIRLGMQSVASRVIVPMQDILGLGHQARMNRPGTAHNNWRWRLRPRQMHEPGVEKRLSSLTYRYGRMPSPNAGKQ